MPDGSACRAFRTVFARRPVVPSGTAYLRKHRENALHAGSSSGTTLAHAGTSRSLENSGFPGFPTRGTAFSRRVHGPRFSGTHENGRYTKVTINAAYFEGDEKRVTRALHVFVDQCCIFSNVTPVTLFFNLFARKKYSTLWHFTVGAGSKIIFIEAPEKTRYTRYI